MGDLTINIDLLDVQAAIECVILGALLVYGMIRFWDWASSYEARRIRAGVRRMMRERRGRGIPT